MPLELLAYTSATSATPEQCEESDAKLVRDGVEMKLRSFSTKVHRRRRRLVQDGGLSPNRRRRPRPPTTSHDDRPTDRPIDRPPRSTDDRPRSTTDRPRGTPSPARPVRRSSRARSRNQKSKQKSLSKNGDNSEKSRAFREGHDFIESPQGGGVVVSSRNTFEGSCRG